MHKGDEMSPERNTAIRAAFESCRAFLCAPPARETHGRRRIDWMDACRSLFIVLMIGYHFLFDLELFGRITREQLHTPVLDVLQQIGAGGFILISGVSSRLSRSNVRRGFLTLCAGFLVMIGGYVIGQPIWFGILQFLGVAMLLYGVLGKYFERVPGTIAVPGYSLLFFLTYVWTASSLVQTRLLWPLGFRFQGFSSADYFPLLPWVFVFLLGAWLGGVLKGVRETSRLYRPLPVWCTWIGRHGLIIYLLHQPLLYGLCLLVF